MKVTFKRFGLPYNPQKDKKNKNKNKIIRHIVWFLIAFIAISVLLTLVVEALIRISIAKLAINDTIDSTWIGSLASYWGGIIGGMISGTLAFIGVFYTIRYYKESDEQKEKAAIQPFLNVTMASGGKATRGFFLGKSKENKKKQLQVNVNIKNIGNGWKKILWESGKIAFIFSISIEMLQLLLRLGTFQLSDIFYNTVGGVLGGLLYCVAMKARKRL